MSNSSWGWIFSPATYFCNLTIFRHRMHSLCRLEETLLFNSQRSINKEYGLTKKQGYGVEEIEREVTVELGESLTSEMIEAVACSKSFQPEVLLSGAMNKMLRKMLTSPPMKSVPTTKTNINNTSIGPGSGKNYGSISRSGRDFFIEGVEKALNVEGNFQEEEHGNGKTSQKTKCQERQSTTSTPLTRSLAMQSFVIEEALKKQKADLARKPKSDQSYKRRGVLSRKKLIFEDPEKDPASFPQDVEVVNLDEDCDEQVLEESSARQKSSKPQTSKTEKIKLPPRTAAGQNDVKQSNSDFSEILESIEKRVAKEKDRNLTNSFKLVEMTDIITLDEHESDQTKENESNRIWNNVLTGTKMNEENELEEVVLASPSSKSSSTMTEDDSVDTIKASHLGVSRKRPFDTTWTNHDDLSVGKRMRSITLDEDEDIIELN